MIRFNQPADGEGDEIPDARVDGDDRDFGEAWEAFIKLEALSGGGPWQFLPSQVLNEPEPLLSNVLAIKAMKERLKDATQ